MNTAAGTGRFGHSLRMSGDDDGVPAYLTVRMTRREGPLAASADQEAWRARRKREGGASCGG